MFTKVKKFSLLISTVAVCFTLMFIGVCLIAGIPVNKDNVMAAGPIVNYSGPDGSGAGTATNPYIIRQAGTLNSDFFRSRAAIDGNHFVLMDNITLTNAWTPVLSFPANSVFDGNGFEIRNLSITSDSNRGFINSLSGTVKNVTFTNVNILSTGYAGVVAAQITTGNAAIENVAVKGGTLENSSRTGGLVGYIKHQTSTASNRATITIKNSYTENLTIQGQNCTGGIVGFVDSSKYIDLYIQNCFHTGDIYGSSSIVGGILGGVTSGNNNTITIENCYATGNFVSDETYAGGIMGYQNSSPALVNIKNCYADAVISAKSTMGGIFGGGAAASFILVDNCYYNNQKFTGTVGSNLTNVGNKSKGMPLAEMKTQAFVNTLNNSAVFNNWRYITGELPILVDFSQQYSVRFLPNGGTYLGGTTDPKGFDFELDKWFSDEWFLLNDVEQPTRIGHEFEAWNTKADGTGENYQKTELKNIPQTNNLALYANWRKIQYTVTEYATSNSSNQNPMIISGAGEASNKTTIGSSGYISTSLNTNTTAEQFLGFKILKNTELNRENPADASWVNLGSGEETSGVDLFKAFKLSFEGLIDELFVSSYAFSSDRSFVFKAEYSSGELLNVKIDAGETIQKSYGSLKVGEDNDQNMVNVSFGATLNFVTNKTIVIDAIANAHRECTSFLIEGVHGAPTITSSGNNRRLVIEITGNVTIKAIFEPVLYTVVLSGITANNTPVTGSYVSGTCPDVKINSNFSGATFRTVDGFRLKNTSTKNVKIWNYLEGKYDDFTAYGGSISTMVFGGITSDFLTKYADTVNRRIEIIADYVKQNRLDINIALENSELGKVDVYITSPDGSTYELSLASLSASSYFDENSIVEIVITSHANVSALINSLPDDIKTEEHGITTWTYTLSSTRTTTISFSKVLYKVNYKIVDAINYELLELNGLSLVSSAETILENDSLALQINRAQNIEGYNFVKWIAKKGNKEYILSENIEGNTTGVTGWLTIEMSKGFLNSWSENGEITIFAVFAAEYIVKVNIEGSGTCLTEIVSGEEIRDLDDAGKMYLGGTVLKISFTADIYYEFDSINGLKGNETIVLNQNYVFITANEFIRDITIKFRKIGYEIDLVQNLSGGSVEVFSSINNPGKLSIGDQIRISFNPSVGQELKTWTINGTDVQTLKDQGVATVNGNTVIITITADWLTANIGKEGRIECTITTEMSKMLLIVIVASAIFIPLIAFGAVILMIQNRRKKEAYAKAVLRMREVEKGFQAVDIIRSLHEGN